MNSDIREWEYRHYVANSLRYLPQNKYIQPTLYELLHPDAIDNRSGDEIVEDVMAKAGLNWE